SDESQHGATPNVSGGEGGLKQNTSADRPADAFEGELDVLLKKAATSKGLTESETEEARVAATNAVREALRKPGDLPPRSL
ncbi:unnamed protein product, partial [Ectocarpus fasciculatus]